MISKVNTELDEKNSYLSGVGKHGDGLISLLNIQGVIND
jgi:purine-binding chemotaxis protein CheW